MAEVTTSVAALRWRDGLECLDQRLLPARESWLPVATAGGAARAIQALVVRGAPAIGLTAAYALASEARANPELTHLRRAARRLASSRPTGADPPPPVQPTPRGNGGAPQRARDRTGAPRTGPAGPSVRL